MILLGFTSQEIADDFETLGFYELVFLSGEYVKKLYGNLRICEIVAE